MHSSRSTIRIQPPCKVLEGLGGQIGMDDMKVGVQHEGATQVVLCLLGVAEALRQIGYQGYLSAEILPWPDSDAAARQTIESFRRYAI